MSREAKPVSTITSVSGHCFFNRGRSSSPSASGSFKSSSTRSGGGASNHCLTVASSLASRTSKPSSTSSVTRNCRTSASSSTTRILFFTIACSRQCRLGKQLANNLPHSLRFLRPHQPPRNPPLHAIQKLQPVIQRRVLHQFPIVEAPLPGIKHPPVPHVMGVHLHLK